MNVRGERILIFGDSLSHHGADDAPEIWDVTAGSARISAAPGDLLASLLLEAGAQAVRINANVGRSAKNFWTAPNRRQTHTATQLIVADRTFRPTKVLVMLGTNDADAGGMDTQAITRIRDTYAEMGAEVWGIGPPVFANPAMAAAADRVYGTLGAVFGPKLIDARPLSSTLFRASDGVHFQSVSAKAFANKLAQAVASPHETPTVRPAWVSVATGFGIALAVGLLGLWVARRSRGLGLLGERLPAYFVDPESGDVIDVDQRTAKFRAPDQLPGGRGDGRPDEDFDPAQLHRGIVVELEHTYDRAIAKEIAKDHLTEDPDYYRKLHTLHLDD